MRSLLYGTAVIALAAGLLCAGAYASFAVSLLVHLFVPREWLPWLYAAALAGFGGWVVFSAWRVLAALARRGPPSAFRGWRYAAAAACAVLFVLNLLAVVMPVLVAAETRRLIGVPFFLPLSYLPVMLLAMAALPPAAES